LPIGDSAWNSWRATVLPITQTLLAGSVGTALEAQTGRAYD
jgi:hypothetical protein